MPLLLTQFHNAWPFGSSEPDSFAVNDAVRLIESSGTPMLEDCQWSYTYVTAAALRMSLMVLYWFGEADWPLLLALGFSDSGGSAHQQHITSLLEGELPKLKTVKTLEVCEVFGVEDAASAAEPSVDNPEPRKLMKRDKLDIAEPTIVWFKERASKLDNEKGEN
ncbi:hypothetical protein BPOR_0656g00080 [Botrytis porri]|uniref:Uncharacterized protein n=1 Tax=Botrytis porri TaxID=87229 RepID=A0A4Z1KPZ2_9HELO|nr:hypothetical protein BPOR_0656g00080 [Botrytis porri]